MGSHGFHSQISVQIASGLNSFLGCWGAAASCACIERVDSSHGCPCLNFAQRSLPMFTHWQHSARSKCWRTTIFLCGTLLGHAVAFVAMDDNLDGPIPVSATQAGQLVPRWRFFQAQTTTKRTTTTATRSIIFHTVGAFF